MIHQRFSLCKEPQLTPVLPPHLPFVPREPPVIEIRKGQATASPDLRLVTSDDACDIHPCQGCGSTPMSLCHWPDSCYRNDVLGQTHGLDGGDQQNLAQPRP